MQAQGGSHHHFARRLRLLAAGVLLAASALPRPQLGAESAAGELQDVRSVEDLRARFNRDSGRVRLVLLLSPT